jgi:hypothetical protein
VAGSWRRLHNKELHNLHASPDIIHVIKSRMRWAEHITCMGSKKCRQYLVRKPEGKRHFGRSRCRWEDNMRMDLRETGLEGVE